MKIHRQNRTKTLRKKEGRENPCRQQSPPRASGRRWAGLFFLIPAILCLTAVPASAQLSAAWIVPAAAHTSGWSGTFWKTDLSIENPQDHDLQLVIQYLPRDRNNAAGVLTMDLVIYPWETINFWDVLGPDGFFVNGTGAILIYVPLEVECAGSSCDFLVSSRTYTLDPWGSGGELAQGIPGAALMEGTDWASFGYVTGVLNDGNAFRCNVGVASWTADWTTVQVDVQNSDGVVLNTEVLDVPPFGQVQRRLQTRVSGGTLVYYLVDGPSDSFVYPYASVVDEDTGDPSYFFARYSGVGVSKKARVISRREGPPRSRTLSFKGKRSRISVRKRD